MASGILGGGDLTPNLQAHGYTAPSGKTTTTSLLLFSGATAGTVFLYLGSVTIPVNVPANGFANLTGLILGAGQSVYLTASVSGISYLLTGWESAV